jgi:CheY-like chemotaxis protein
MNEQGPQIERRRHARVYVRGPATVRGRRREVPGYVIAVSETTLEIRCQLRSALLAMVGASVEVEMRLDGQIGEVAGWFVLHGQVARVRFDNQSLIIQIGALPRPLVALIERIRRSAVPPVEAMIVDREVARRTRVAEAFRAEGCQVIEVATPIEALHWLERGWRGTDVFAVADTIPDTIGIDLRAFLDTSAPDALVVSLGGPEWTPGRERLDPSVSDGLLASHVRALLLGRSDSIHQSRPLAS